MKKLLLFGLLYASTSFSQFSKPNYCAVDPTLESGLTVSGTFTLNNSGKHDIAHFRQNINGEAVLVVNSNYSGSAVWTGNYNIENFRGRVLNLDADGDGVHNEIVAIHDNGNNSASFLVWQYDLTYGLWYFNIAYTVTNYDVSKLSNRVVAGDFDNDGKYDDIAGFYDYLNFNFKIHVFRFNGNFSMNYNWFYEVYGYDATKTTGRIVSGDFDRDGNNDDIAALYDYGNNNVKMHVFRSNGSSMTQSNYYWEVSGYDPNKVTGTLISGNFDKSGLINHKNDDIVALYDYGNGNVKAHVWANTGNNSFNYYWKWEVSGFNVNEIRGRMFQFQETNDNPEKNFGMAGLYNYGTSTNVFYKWVNNSGSNWNFGTFTPALCGPKSLHVNSEVDESLENELIVYPNPSSNGKIHFVAENIKSIEVYDLNGQKIDVIIDMNNKEINASNLVNGIYLIKFVDENNLEIIKRIVLN